MALNPTKYRLGAPDSIVLDAGGAAPVDLGTSMGGVVLNYKPAYFRPKIDQDTTMPAVWRIEEDASVEFSLAEVTVQKLLSAMSYAPSTVTTVAAGTLAAPTGLTVTPTGAAGAVTYTYQVAAYNSNGDSIPSATASTATGNATLSASNYNALAVSAVPGAVGYRWIRTVGGGSTGLIQSTILPALNDTGLAATAYTNATVNPTNPNTDTGFVGGQAFVPLHTLDFTVPKNDGTSLHWRYSFWKVFADGAVAVDFKRDKNSEFKVILSALGDLTKPVGQRLYRKLEEY